MNYSRYLIINISKIILRKAIKNRRICLSFNIFSSYLNIMFTYSCLSLLCINISHISLPPYYPSHILLIISFYTQFVKLCNYLIYLFSFIIHNLVLCIVYILQYLKVYHCNTLSTVYTMHIFSYCLN